MIDKNIGFIGLGNVGLKLANNINAEDFQLFIHDLDKNLSKELVNNGAIWSDSLSEIISKTSIFITCLPSPSSVKKVIFNIIPLLSKNHLWIDMSTNDENEIIKLSKLCEEKGANVLEAPVTGGAHRAETGNIAILASGKRKIFERAFPILRTMGYEILYCGRIGNASTLKVVTNYLASINLLALGEALMVCKKYGLDLSTAFQGIRISSGNSFVHETESKVILSGSYDVGFTMDLVCKDLGLFTKLTNKFDIPADVSKLIYSIFEEGRLLYGNRALSTSIVKRIENECNEKLRATGFPKKLVDTESKKKGIEIKF